jgi:GrpB-like predicted nucleotidyltransferase (UPF0157 family)
VPGLAAKPIIDVILVVTDSGNEEDYVAALEAYGYVLRIRDWRRSHAADRDLYARHKLALAEKEWKHVRNYADAKTAMIEEILARARPGIPLAPLD